MDAKKMLLNTIMRIDGAYSPATIRAYKVDFLDFILFSEKNSFSVLPTDPQALCRYIQELVSRGKCSASIRRMLAGIATIHKLNKLEDPTKDPEVLLEVRRMHRQIGRYSKQALGVTSELVEALLKATDETIRGLRNRALLLVAYDTLCRRSELISLRIEDIKEIVIDGEKRITLRLRKSKTDQFGIGKQLYLTQKTSEVLKDWLNVLNENNGFLFRGIKNGLKVTDSLCAGQINRIYKRLAREAKLQDEVITKISGHSLRVGHAQDMVQLGNTLPQIMSKGRWSKTDTVMRYVEHIYLV